MSKEAKRGLAAIRNLFAKAGDMGDEAAADDDELERSLEDDFSELDEATAADDNADDSAYDEEGEGDDGSEQHMTTVGKAAATDDEDEDGDVQELDAGPILTDIAKAWHDVLGEVQALREENRHLRRQTGLIAKGMLGLVDEQETLAKSVGDVQREVDQSARLPKSGRGKPKRPQPQRGQQFDAKELLAKASTDTEHFSSRDVSKLESMLNRGDVAGVQREFEPSQLQALGLPVQN